MTYYNIVKYNHIVDTLSVDAVDICSKNVCQNKQLIRVYQKLIIFNFNGQMWTVMDNSVALL